MGQLRIRLSFAVQLGLAFSAAAVVFLLLRTSDYLGVDGALRALQIYDLGRPFLHPNNHLLYPVNVYAWSVFMGWIGIHPKDPLAFLAIAQAMNGFAAAGFLTILYALLYKLTGRAAIACFTTIGYGLSRAFLAHATSSAEPMVGLFDSGVSVMLALYGVTQNRVWACIAGGATLALAMATYQSMVLIGPALVLLISRWPNHQTENRFVGRLLLVLGLAIGLILGVVIVFGTAYSWAGAHSATDVYHKFRETEPALQQNGGLQLVRTASMLAGLAYAAFPCLPRECSGFRCLGSAEYHSWITIAALAIVVTGTWLFALIGFTKKLWVHMVQHERVAFTSCVLAFVLSAMPLAWWLPTYDKLWLQPLACLFLITGIIVHVALRAMDSMKIPGARYFVPSCAAALALIIIPNTVKALWINARPAPYIAQARQVAALVKPEDLLVGDWDPIFLLYQALWGSRADIFNVPTQAIHIGARTVSDLRQTVIRAEERGGNVFFLGLLDVPEPEWKLAFEGRELPYGAFESYRRNADAVESFRNDKRVITLRRFATSSVPGGPAHYPIRAQRVRLGAR